MSGQEGLHDRALDSTATAVDQADFREAASVGGFQIVVDHARHVARRERVEVERLLDRDGDGLLRDETLR